MRLSSHELQELHELTLSCVNSLTNMGLFLNQAQDPELKAMLQRHFPYHVRDYNKKVEYLTEAEGSESPFPVPPMADTMESHVVAPTAPAPVMVPRTDATALNDREIASAYLLTLKRAGREYAWAAMEMPHPEVRTFLEDAFRMCSHQAYDVWQWMAKRGYYPLQPAPEVSVRSIGAMYGLVPEQSVQLPMQ